LRYFQKFSEKILRKSLSVKGEIFLKKDFLGPYPLRDFVALFCYAKNNANFRGFGMQFAKKRQDKD
jgi:hypothetical protein